MEAVGDGVTSTVCAPRRAAAAAASTPACPPPTTTTSQLRLAADVELVSARPAGAGVQRLAAAAAAPPPPLPAALAAAWCRPPSARRHMGRAAKANWAAGGGLAIGGARPQACSAQARCHGTVERVRTAYKGPKAPSNAEELAPLAAQSDGVSGQPGAGSRQSDHFTDAREHQRHLAHPQSPAFRAPLAPGRLQGPGRIIMAT